jgi:hypothetical protein
MEHQMTLRERVVVHQDALARLAIVIGGALLLMFGFAVGSLAHADEIAVNNSVLLDPFDPVPQIHFSDCNDGCGYHRCYDGCGYRRRCYDGCRDYDGWRDGWRCDHDCRYFDHDHWRCERDCGPDPIGMGARWGDRLKEYGDQMEHWRGDMHEWHDAMGEWREENDHWFFHHHDDGHDHHDDHHDGHP